MRYDFRISKRQQAQGKVRTHWGILTLDDLPNTNVRYSQLIAQVQARYRAGKGLGDDKPGQKSED